MEASQPHSPDVVQKQPNKRRHFLAGAGVASVAVAAVALKSTRAPILGMDAHNSPQTEAGSGYRLSAHIRKYYQTTTL